MERLSGWAELGNQTITVAGLNSSNATPVQRSFPGCNVSVFPNGNNNLATIYADNNGTPLANPFTASNTGFWFFYAPNGRYDVQFSGGGLNNAVTLADLPLGAIQSINNQNGDTQTFATGNSGNDFAISSANNVHTFNLPTASNANRGALNATDWVTFNSKQAPLNFIAPLNNTNNNVTLTTPLAILYGGTGQNNAVAGFDALSPANTLGDLIVANNTNINVRLPIGGNGTVLTANGSNANFGLLWAMPNMNNVNGVLAIVNGGTGNNNKSSAFDGLSPTTTLGDLILFGNNGSANTNVRQPAGANGQVLMANSSNTSSGVVWAAINLNSNSVTGTLPITSGGTGANNATAAFNALSPANTAGDLITSNGNNNVRLPVGSNNQVLTAAGNNSSGLIWSTPAVVTQKFTVASNNNAFVANSTGVSISLFNLGQFQKILGITAKPSALFLNANNTMTDVTLSIGHGGNAAFYTSNLSIGNNGAVGNSNFQDTDLFKSGNMGASEAVLAQFTAANNNFGNGAATGLLSGSVDIWISTIQLQ